MIFESNYKDLRKYINICDLYVLTSLSYSLTHIFWTSVLYVCIEIAVTTCLKLRKGQK